MASKIARGQISIATWHKVTKNYKKISQAIKSDEDLSIPIAIINPDNHQRALYVVKNGKTQYDFTDELNTKKL